MRHVTVDDIMAAGPCERYSREMVLRLWDGRESITPEEVVRLPIPPPDQMWVMAHVVLGADARRRLAGDIVRDAATLIAYPLGSTPQSPELAQARIAVLAAHSEITPDMLVYITTMAVCAARRHASTSHAAATAIIAAEHRYLTMALRYA